MFRTVLRHVSQGRFNYKQCFDSFIESTTQKNDTATLLSEIVRGFEELGLVYQNKVKSLRVADIGCANALASLLILEKMNHPNGYDYRGIDHLSNYVVAAQKALSANICIRKYDVSLGDALCGNLSNTLYSQEKFDLVFVSHVAYYLPNEAEKYKRFINDMRQLLSIEGVVFFMHGNSHTYLLSKYSKNNSNNTPYVKVHTLLEQYAKELDCKSTYIDFVSKLHFEALDDKLWEAMEKTINYKSLQKDRVVMSTLEKLSMVINRDLSTLEKEGKLQNFIQDAKEIITKNGGFLYLHTHLQAMVSNECQISLELIAEKMKNALNKNAELIIDDSQLTTLNQPKEKPVNAPSFGY